MYVEKPCSHDMFEAKQIVAAARKYDRLVQQGSQSRSSPALQEAVQSMRDGLLGEVYMARGLCFKWRDTIGHTPVEPVPPGVDYDLWLGPAPQHAFTKNRFHYNWHWFWDYGNGDLGNQGIHELDIARWGLGVTYPTKVTAMGGHFMFDDDQETPNTITASYEFNDGGKEEDDGIRSPPLDEQSRSRHRRSPIEEREVRIEHDRQFVLRLQRLHGDRRLHHLQTWLGKEQEPGPTRTAGETHFENFISAVRSRKRSDLNAEIEEGAISTTLIHLANISYRVGRTLNFDAASYTLQGRRRKRTPCSRVSIGSLLWFRNLLKQLRRQLRPPERNPARVTSKCVTARTSRGVDASLITTPRVLSRAVNSRGIETGGADIEDHDIGLHALRMNLQAA